MVAVKSRRNHRESPFNCCTYQKLAARIDDTHVPGFPEWFNLKYEDDDDIYTARLEEEFQDGDVLIRV
ncbi:hypothetical protein DPMN_181877 [Dreissena polymorpha]|uniref:Uncharacterized protein n=2 Tax=Dreissena polymorpha TaxID=45954 RepID=A0A9D4DF90_DREPO|nr:hypothetical protein DPMN_181877 [Dreissena polymorpha]